MENKEISELIDTFVGYREMLIPIQSDMHDFLDTFVSIKGDIDKIDKAFSGDVQAKLNEIYKILSSQATKSEELTRKVDQFLKSSSRYTEEVDNLISMFQGIESRIVAVNQIEEKANEQIGKLDQIIEEKKKNYNLKDLEKSLEAYNNNLEQVGEFINKDIAENIVNNSKSIQSIKDSHEDMLKKLDSEKRDLETLSKSLENSNKLLQRVVEKEDVNEEYIFDIIDRWAESRKVKTK